MGPPSMRSIYPNSLRLITLRYVAVISACAAWLLRAANLSTPPLLDCFLGLPWFKTKLGGLGTRSRTAS